MFNRNRNTVILCSALACVCLAGALPAVEAIAKLDETLFLGKPVVAENVTVWPVYAREKAEKMGHLVTLTDAQKKGKAVVRELGAEVSASAGNNRPAEANETAEETPQTEQRDQTQTISQTAQPSRQSLGDARVGQLVIENKGDAPVLVLAGTLVKGGKQDRQIAQDFIIPPGKTVPVNAFCVERGRWRVTREGKNTKGVFVAQETLAPKAVRESGQFSNDQSEVWKKVSIQNTTAGKAPDTGTLMAAVEETDKEALARRKRISGSIVESFEQLAESDEAPVGLAYAIDGKIKVVQRFAHPKIMDHYRGILANTIAIEGDLAQRKAIAAKKKTYEGTAGTEQVVKLIRDAKKLKEERSVNSAGNENGVKRSKILNYSRVSVEKSEEGQPAKNASESWSVAE